MFYSTQHLNLGSTELPSYHFSFCFVKQILMECPGGTQTLNQLPTQELQVHATMLVAVFPMIFPFSIFLYSLTSEEQMWPLSPHFWSWAIQPLLSCSWGCRSSNLHMPQGPPTLRDSISALFLPETHALCLPSADSCVLLSARPLPLRTPSVPSPPFHGMGSGTWHSLELQIVSIILCILNNKNFWLKRKIYLLSCSQWPA